jgi:hypothetical protein
VAALAIVVFGAGACSEASDPVRGPAPTEPTTSPPPTKPGVTALIARLSGKSVVPGPGALSGSGTATLSLDPAAEKVCYELTVRNVDPVTSATVFTGPAGALGPVTIPLEPPGDDNKSSGCAEAARGIVESIIANPAGFYVSVDNVQFPGGALRAQLAR